TDEVRERAAALVGAEPWGREQWERLAEGLLFDGMESWLPWLTEGEHVVLDLVGPDAQILLVEPRRMRDRAADLLAEEADVPGADSVVVAPLERGFVLPNVKLAVLAESDVTGRRRAHRQARPRTRRTDATSVFEDLQPGDYVVHHQHGVARYAGMVTRSIGG